MNSNTRLLKVFLCHSSGDKSTVRELYHQLKVEGWIDVWLDEMKLLPGQDWDMEIEKAVEEADIVLVCLSTDSVSKEGYIQKELRFVLNIADEKPEGTIFVIPLRLDNCTVPRRLRNWQRVDFFPIDQRKLAYERLLESFRARAKHLGLPILPAPEIAVSPPPKEDELDALASQAIQYELKGDFWNALQTYYKIKRIDPFFPRVDINIQRLERAWQGLNRVRQVLQRVWQANPVRKTVGGILVLFLMVLGFLAGSRVINNSPLFKSTSTQISQPANTDTPALTETSSVSTTAFRPSETITPLPLLTLTSAISTLSIGSTIVSDKDGMTLIYVPAGEFIMGSNTGTAEEKPEHTANLDPFWIDKTEVTVEMYSLCVSAGVCQDKSLYTQTDYLSNPKFNEYPVTFVSWEDAKNYCEWVDRRLPTEAEWEKAARGGNGLIYPWGNNFDGTRLNFCDKNCSLGTPNTSFDDGFAEAARVGSYLNGASPYGALDMAGNVWELVADWYDEEYYVDSPETNPEGPESGQYRVIRGGSWVTHLEFGLRTSYRAYLDPDIGNNDIGFRCAMSATQ